MSETIGTPTPPEEKQKTPPNGVMLFLRNLYSGVDNGAVAALLDKYGLAVSAESVYTGGMKYSAVEIPSGKWSSEALKAETPEYDLMEELLKIDVVTAALWVDVYDMLGNKIYTTVSEVSDLHTRLRGFYRELCEENEDHLIAQVG